MSASAILEELAACGITPGVTADGTGIEVPGGRLTDEQRQRIKACKPELIRCIREQHATSAEPADWRPLARAYHAHHFACRTCQVSGQGYGLRCGTGAALWSGYREAAEADGPKPRKRTDKTAKTHPADPLADLMRACDGFGDSSEARDEMRRQFEETPPHLRAGLLEHFQRTYRGERER